MHIGWRRMFPCLKISRQFQWAYRCLPVAEFVTIIFIQFWFLTRWFNKFNKSTALNFVKAKHFARFIRCHKLYQCSRSFITPHLDFSVKNIEFESFANLHIHKTWLLMRSDWFWNWRYHWKYHFFKSRHEIYSDGGIKHHSKEPFQKHFCLWKEGGLNVHVKSIWHWRGD